MDKTTKAGLIESNVLPADETALRALLQAAYLWCLEHPRPEDEAALQVVESAEPLMTLAPDGKRVVMLVTPKAAVVDHDWVAGS